MTSCLLKRVTTITLSCINYLGDLCMLKPYSPKSILTSMKKNPPKPADKPSRVLSGAALLDLCPLVVLLGQLSNWLSCQPSYLVSRMIWPIVISLSIFLLCLLYCGAQSIMTVITNVYFNCDFFALCLCALIQGFSWLSTEHRKLQTLYRLNSSLRKCQV